MKKNLGKLANLKFNRNSPKNKDKEAFKFQTEHLESLKSVKNAEDDIKDEEKSLFDQDNEKIEENENRETKEEKVQIQRNLDDLVAMDLNKRTILHRAALEQNEALLLDIINDYSDILVASDSNERNMKNLNDFINTKDKFGCSPLLIACSLRLDSDITRINSVNLLIKYGADVNIRNDRTFWNAMHWIAYHGDEACAKTLLERNIEINHPDHQGFYPLDITGKQV